MPCCAHCVAASRITDAILPVLGVVPLDRENQALQQEHAALAERLRLAGASGADGPAARMAAAAAQADAEQARQQLAEAEQAAEQARSAAQAAQAAARKLEADLEDLSAAYSTLDAHAGALQQQTDGLQRELRELRQQQAGGAEFRGGISEAEVEQRVATARVEAQQEAQREADDAMADLLVCLGQEEAKVRGGRGAAPGLGEDAGSTA